MFIKTPPGKRCPFPDGTVVTEKPIAIANSAFLRRRLRDGSVMLTTKTQESQLQKTKPNEKSRKTKQTSTAGE